jgi:hypothetical protein
MLAQNVAFRLGYLDLAAQANLLWRDAAGRSGDPLRPATAAPRPPPRSRSSCACTAAITREFSGSWSGAHAEIADERTAAADSVRAQPLCRRHQLTNTLTGTLMPHPTTRSPSPTRRACDLCW